MQIFIKRNVLQIKKERTKCDNTVSSQGLD